MIMSLTEILIPSGAAALSALRASSSGSIQISMLTKKCVRPASTAATARRSPCASVNFRSACWRFRQQPVSPQSSLGRCSSGAGCTAFNKGVDIGKDNTSMGTGPLDQRQINIVLSGQPFCQRAGNQPCTLLLFGLPCRCLRCHWCRRGLQLVSYR